jgi:Protein of unknown function (DUF5818)
MTRSLFVFLLLAAIASPLLVHAQDKTFSGEIMDSQCAGLGDHSIMMGSSGLKTAKECTVACVKAGGKYVLFAADTKKTYQLDDQKRPEPFAGEKVTVSGTYDASTQTIHVEKIEAAK